jgi:leader peptidase (prepilin peptidase)/N-methyltransferase
MGFGDVKFAFVIGYLLGFPKIVVALYAAFLIGAIVSVILIILKKKKLRGDTIAFGPFMIIGIGIALLYTDAILELFF